SNSYASHHCIFPLIHQSTHPKIHRMAPMHNAHKSSNPVIQQSTTDSLSLLPTESPVAEPATVATQASPTVGLQQLSILNRQLSIVEHRATSVEVSALAHPLEQAAAAV